MDTLAWFESTLLSIWVRESPLVFPTILIVHGLGMGMVVGANVFLAWCAFRSPSLRASLPSLAAIVWTGFVLSFASGALLLSAYPAKALTNPTFYLKAALIVLGLLLFLRAERRQRTSDLRLSAVVLVAVWFATVTTGRLLAYTHSVLLASHLY